MRTYLCEIVDLLVLGAMQPRSVLDGVSVHLTDVLQVRCAE